MFTLAAFGDNMAALRFFYLPFREAQRIIGSSQEACRNRHRSVMASALSASPLQLCGQMSHLNFFISFSEVKMIVGGWVLGKPMIRELHRRGHTGGEAEGRML